MRVFVVGASGAIGTRLVPQLIARGHQVIGTFMSPGNAECVRALGAEPIVLDLLDADAVRKAVLDAKPEAIVHPPGVRQILPPPTVRGGRVAERAGVDLQRSEGRLQQ